MRRILLRLLINGLGLYAAERLVPGVYAVDEWRTFVIAAVFFSLVNALIRPILKFLTCPLLILTLGLFSLVINALMLWLTGSLASKFGIGFYIAGFWPAFWGALVVSLVNLVSSLLIEGE